MIPVFATTRDHQITKSDFAEISAMHHACLAVVTTLLLTACRGDDDGNVTVVQLGMLTHVVELSSAAGECSGSIISEEFVLTAAHCLATITSSKIFGRYRTYSMHLVPHNGVSVKAGVTDMMPTELEHRQETTSVEVIVHPRFRPMKLAGFDIGLVRVSPRFNFSDVIFQVEISEKGWKIDENRSSTCQTSGFGDMTNLPTAVLRLWDVKALHGENSCPCSKRFQWKRLVCTASEGKLKICNGDSGAGLICDAKIVAVSHMVRDKKSCDNLDYPKCSKGTLNTYTFLCPLNDWIKKYVPLAPPTPKSCLAPHTWPVKKYLAMCNLLLFFVSSIY